MMTDRIIRRTRKKVTFREENVNVLQPIITNHICYRGRSKNVDSLSVKSVVSFTDFI